MVALLCLIVGLAIGYLFRDIKEFEKEIRKKFDVKPDVGITPGLYQRANEGNVNQDGETGLVTPKTPQRLEWEEQERLREQQLRGH